MYSNFIIIFNIKTNRAFTQSSHIIRSSKYKFDWMISISILLRFFLKSGVKVIYKFISYSVVNNPLKLC